MSDERHSGSPDRIFCMHCGTEGKVGAYACVRCGEHLYFADPEHPPPLGYVGCGSCGAANESHAVYCAHCQAEIVEGDRFSPSAHSYGDLRDHAGATPEREREVASGVAVMEDAEREDGGTGLIPPQRSQQDDEDSRLPSELRGWNWPAFLLGPIWGVGHRIWWTAIGFLALAPLVNAGPRQAALLFWLAMMLFLGFRGNELAWRARRWESVEKFMAAQQRWGVWAVAAIAVLVVGMVVYMYVQ